MTLIQNPNPPLILRNLFDRAVAAADPMETIFEHLPKKPSGRVVIIGAGKASARMAEAVERVWGECSGIVITRYGYKRPCKGIEIVEAAHPVPDESGVEATKKMLELMHGLSEDDFVLCLISGGASALLCAPSSEITLAEKQHINHSLLESGAPIDQINIVRKHLSAVKGGQLAAAAYPARMLSLILSDVPGDDIQFIGSGPTVGDTSTCQQALQIICDYNISVSSNLIKHLETKSGVLVPQDIRLSKIQNVIFAAPSQSLQAATKMANNNYGFKVINLGDALQGEAREVARQQAEQAIQIQNQLSHADNPVLLLSGGELTVTKNGNGVGGPNAEFCLALAIFLDQQAGIFGLAGDTDGVDGADEIAGAYVTPDTLDHAIKANISPKESLFQNDAHSFFGTIRNQIITGPTFTNVNDFRAILIYPS